VFGKSTRCNYQVLGCQKKLSKSVYANPGVNVNWVLNFLCVKKRFSQLLFCVVWDYSNPKQGPNNCKQKTFPQSYKTEIKIITSCGLA